MNIIPGRFDGTVGYRCHSSLFQQLELIQKVETIRRREKERVNAL